MAPKQLKKCPICSKSVSPKGEFYPFCSQRCKTVDLGKWASESYVAHSPLTEADENLDSSDQPPQDD